jgi:small-conductance mechanosensitive channel
VAYDSSLEEVARLALEAVSSIPGLLVDPEPVVHFQGFGASSIDLTVFYWIDTSQTDPLTAKDIGLQQVKQALEKAGIEIPYPIQMVINK